MHTDQLSASELQPTRAMNRLAFVVLVVQRTLPSSVGQRVFYASQISQDTRLCSVSWHLPSTHMRPTEINLCYTNEVMTRPRQHLGRSGS
mmetsp:Transcript_16780/g.28644  ORF Transcript_16780/g.28644 Transcript_16780/m.28644 type:complete len:90 (+) Transcript_16780:45-314(+)